jgi:broad specificity phosphatase PhoE
MPTTTRWWWIRHAPVPADGRIYGQMDLPADVGEEAVFAGLASVLPDSPVWVLSQLQRTHQTAGAILAARGRTGPEEPVVVTDLAEQHFGNLQGRPRDEVMAEQGTAWNRFWLTPADRAPEGGESFTDLIRRVERAVERLSQAHAGRDIVAVAHGGTIRAALAQALGLPPEQALAFVIDNCSLTRIDHIAAPDGEGPPAWRVHAVNYDARGQAR